MELSQDYSSSVTLTQKEFAEKLQPLGTSPQLWAARQKLLSPEDVKLCQCKLGELCWLATVSRPDICARLARIASRINALTGSDVYRINDLVKTVKTRQKLLSPEDVKLCQCKLGELCWLATVSRPDICARSARIAPRINALTGGDV